MFDIGPLTEYGQEEWRDAFYAMNKRYGDTAERLRCVPKWIVRFFVWWRGL
jgi:hypothetical protein